MYHLDSDGFCFSEASRHCDYFYITPSHQAHTGVCMGQEHHAALLAPACHHDQIIIEDNYDSELNFAANPPTALKARDTHSLVIYVSSLSKSLSPGLAPELSGGAGGIGG